MAVVVEHYFDGASVELYDAVIAARGLKPHGPHVPGILFHWVTVTEQGLHVTDVWESREQYEQFVRERLAPINHALGNDTAPREVISEVYSYLTAG